MSWSTNPAVLRRFAAFAPGQPLPQDFKSWAMANMPIAQNIREVDPQLYSLLDGTAPADLVADAIQGSFSPVPPTRAEMESQKLTERKQFLYDSKCFVPGATFNLSYQLEMAKLDPKLAERCKAEAATAAQNQVSDAKIQRDAELARLALMSKNGITGKVA